MSKAKSDKPGVPRKLTPDAVRAIRQDYWSNTRRERETLSQLAARFGVSRITIWHVANGYTWKHVA